MVKTVLPFNAQQWNLNDKNSKIRRALTLKAKAALAVAAVLIILVITVTVVCLLVPDTILDKQYWLPDYHSGSKLGRYQTAAVSTDGAPCAAIGKDMLLRNGSAVDAAIAVLVCMGLVNPQSSGLGGGFLMLVYNRTTETPTFLDAREVAPAQSNATMFDGNGTSSTVGGLSIAVPGELAGYVEAHKTYGVLPWEDLFQPTIKLCREGVAVNKHLAKALRRYAEFIKMFEPIRNVFVNNETGEVFVEGDIIKRPDLANTLEIIANQSSKAVYGPSETADNLLNDLKAVGSIIEKTDMSSYLPRFRQPVKMKLKNNMTVYSVSPPGSGALLAFMLGILDGYRDMDANVTKTQERTVLAMHRIVESFKFAYARRMDMEDSDSLQMKELVKNLTSREYADSIRKKINDSTTYDDPRHYGARVAIKEDHGTAHLSIIAPNGDAVSVTSTINLYFGSLMLSPSTGILFNNEMDDFSSPNITNYFGVPPTTKNHIKPGRRPMSSMSPAIVVDGNGEVRLAVGGNGGTQITTSVTQIIVRNLWFGDDIKRTIDGPRLHHQLLPNYIECEDLFPDDILDELVKLGHKFKRLEGGMVGIIMALARENDYIYANSDYRKEGAVDGF